MKSTESVFAERLRVKRSMIGVSQRSFAAALADRCGINMDTSALARIETGAQRISLDEAVAICNVLGVDLGYMIQSDTPSELVGHIKTEMETKLGRLG